MSSSFSGTLIVLPVVVLGLWLVSRWISRRGVPPLQSRVLVLGMAALALLILVIRGRSTLGLGAPLQVIDNLLAGSLFLLLALYVVRLVFGLVVAVGDTPSRVPPWPFFLLPLVVFIAVLPWATEHRQPDGDEPYYLLIAHSLAHDLDTDLANNYEARDSLNFMTRVLEPEWADPTAMGKGVFSRHNLALPLLLAPGYLLAGKWGAFLTMTVISALAAWMMLRLAWRLWPDQASISVKAWALLALTPPFMLYSYQVWSEIPAALLVLIALDLLHGLKAGEGASVRRWLFLGLVVVFLPLLKLRFALVAVPLVVLAVWRVGIRRKGVVAVTLALVLAVSAILAYNLVVFGQPLKDHTPAQLLEIQSTSPVEYVRGASGLLFDCAFGLFASNPLWLLLIPATVLLVRPRQPILGDLLVCGLPYLLVVTPRMEWYGAWAPPFRFGIVLLPLLALALVPLLAGRRIESAHLFLAGLGAASLWFGILWLVVPGWTYNVANGTSHLIDHLSGVLGADTGRFFPSFVRLRTASWLGPTSVVVATLLFWALPARRPSVNWGWGIALFLSLVAAIPVGATRLVTTIVEFEDQQVSKLGGEVYPKPWVPARPRFRGGWVIASGESLTTPVNAGSSSVTISVELQLRQFRSAESLTLNLRAEDRILSTSALSLQPGWQAVAVSVADWPRGSPLSISIGVSGEESSAARMVLDRARFDWN